MIAQRCNFSYGSLTGQLPSQFPASELPQLFRCEPAPLPGLQFPECEQTFGNRRRRVTVTFARSQSPADLAVSSLMNRDAQQRRFVLRAKGFHFGRTRRPSVNFDGAGNGRLAARYVPAQPDEVDLVHLFFGVREPVCKVLRRLSKQQPLGVEVESSHRIHPRAAAGYQLGDVFAPFSSDSVHT